LVGIAWQTTRFQCVKLRQTAIVGSTSLCNKMQIRWREDKLSSWIVYNAEQEIRLNEHNQNEYCN
jgi:hypothetical protein